MSDFSHEQYTPDLAELYQAAVKVARNRRSDPEPLLRGLHDLLQLEDRMDFVDAGEWFAKDIPIVTPDVGMINGRETGLFYRGQTNMLFGQDSVGKTLLMQAIVKQELEAGHHVGYLDFEEMTPDSFFRRLQEMGLDESVQAEYGPLFHYMNVHRPMSKANREMIATRIAHEKWSLIVIDSVGSMMNVHGGDENKDGDVYNVLYDKYGMPFAEAGAAVVMIDHTTKSSDGMASSGSKRKRAHISGAAYFVDVHTPNKSQKDDDGEQMPSEAWSRTKAGRAKIHCRKDRHGTYVRNEIVATVDVFPMELSATHELIVEFNVFQDVSDIVPDEEAVAPPSTKPSLSDLERAIMRVLESQPQPVQNSFIRNELALKGMTVTRSQLELTMKGLAANGWAHMAKASETSTGTSGWIVLRVPAY